MLLYILVCPCFWHPCYWQKHYSILIRFIETKLFAVRGGGDHLITHHGYSLCRPVAISVIGGGGLYSCSQILKTIDFKIN